MSTPACPHGHPASHYDPLYGCRFPIRVQGAEEKCLPCSQAAPAHSPPPERMDEEIDEYLAGLETSDDGEMRDAVLERLAGLRAEIAALKKLLDEAARALELCEAENIEFLTRADKAEADNARLREALKAERPLHRRFCAVNMPPIKTRPCDCENGERIARIDAALAGGGER